MRSEAKAAALAAGEVLLVVGSLEKPESWSAIAADCQVLIHAASDYSQFEKVCVPFCWGV